MLFDVAVEIVNAFRHPNITAKHPTTLEITKDKWLSRRGDCIIGVNADKSLVDFSAEFKNMVRNKDTIVIVILSIGNIKEIIVGHGDPRLTYSSPRKIIIRRSSYIDESTALIRSSKAARDLDRMLVSKLRSEDIRLRIMFIALKLHKINSIDVPIRRIVKDFPNPHYIP